MSKCTIKDISKMVGVSVGTVSRVLNNAENVDPELVRRTLEAVKAANFVPSRRGPKPQKPKRNSSKRKLSLLVLMPDMAQSWTGNLLWSEYVSGIEKACASRGAQYSFLMAESLRPGSRLDEYLEEGSGILLKTPQENLSVLERLPAGTPVVAFGALRAGLPMPQTALDDHAAGRVAAERLLASGHRRIAFVSCNLRNRMFLSRGQGYAEAMKLAGLFRQELLLEEPCGTLSANPAFTPEGSLPDMRPHLDAMLALPKPPSAVVFANDWMAFGFYKACADKGLSIPDAFSVMGIDGLRPLCEMSMPPLSTVDMPFAKSSCHAANALLDLLEKPGSSEAGASVSHLPVGFSARASVKPLQAS